MVQLVVCENGHPLQELVQRLNQRNVPISCTCLSEGVVNKKLELTGCLEELKKIGRAHV